MSDRISNETMQWARNLAQTVQVHGYTNGALSIAEALWAAERKGMEEGRKQAAEFAEEVEILSQAFAPKPKEGK